MRSKINDILPVKVRQSMKKFGQDVSYARRRRGLTIEMMSERLGVSIDTYRKVEKGEGTVAFHVYAMTLYVLGLGTPFLEIIDSSKDTQGIMLSSESLPKRVRPKVLGK